MKDGDKFHNLREFIEFAALHIEPPREVHLHLDTARMIGLDLDAAGRSFIFDSVIVTHCGVGGKYGNPGAQ